MPEPSSTDALALLARVWGQHDPSGADSTLPLTGEPPQPASPITGSIGRYRVLHPLGAGGYGLVYAAEDPTVGRTIALKIARPEYVFDLDARSRFLDEARLAGSLNHPGIVRVLDAGEADGVWFIASELCEGPNLAFWLREQRDPVPPRAAAALVLRACQAVAAAHAKGIVHRDLKPGNVLLVQPPNPELDPPADLLPGGWVPKVTDFGLAKLLEGGSDRTRTGAAAGTPQYMAPEQTSNAKTVGPTADVWALGVILYEMLTGVPPFRGESTVETLRLVCDTEPASPRRVRPGTPVDLETICLKCLQKEPRKRYASVEELGDDLNRFLHGLPIRARSISSAELLWRRVRRNPMLSLFGGLFIASLLIGIVATTILSLNLREQVAIARSHAATADEQRLEAIRQKRAADDALFETLMTQARSIRQRGGQGQRTESLRVLRQAVALWKPEDFRNRAEREQQLRDQIMSSLMLPDLEVAREIPCPAADTPQAVGLDAQFRTCCWSDAANNVHIANTSDGTIRTTIPTSDNRTGAEGVLSPDGKSIAIRYSNRSVDVWQLDAPAPRRLARSHASHPRSMAFTSDSSQLALGQQGQVSVLSLPTGAEVFRATIPKGAWVNLVKWHPRQPLIACSQENSRQVDLIDAQSHQPIGSFTHPAAVAGLSWNPVWPYLGVGCHNGSTYFWELNTRKLVLTVPAHDAAGVNLQFNPHGNLVVSHAWNGELAVWSAPVGNAISRLRIGEMIEPRFTADGLEFGPELAANKIRTWRVIPEAELRLYVLRSHDSLQPAMSPDGGVLLVGMPTRGLMLWDLRTGQILDHLLQPELERLVFIADDVAIGIAPALSDGKAILYRIPLNRQQGVIGTPVPLLQTAARFVSEVDYCARSHQLILATGNGVALWTLTPDDLRVAPAEVPQLDPHRTSPVNRVAQGGVARLLSKPPRAPDRTFTAPDIRYAALSPDGQWLAGGSHLERGVKVWRVADGELVATLPTASWSFVVFGRGGRWLATHDGRCRLWHVGTWTEGPPIAPSERRRSVRPSFAGNDELVAFGDGQLNVRISQTATGHDVANFEVHQVVHRLDFSANDRWLMGLGERGAVGVLDLELLRAGVESMDIRWNLP